MIYTVTFNPSLDYIVTVDDFKLGLTNRTTSELMLPGGKGINVSIVLSNLGIENTALYFAAGFVGREITAKVKESGILADAIEIGEGCSRINLKLKSIDGTEINGMGPEISPEKLEVLMTKLDALKEGFQIGKSAALTYAGAIVKLTGDEKSLQQVIGTITMVEHGFNTAIQIGNALQKQSALP